MTTPRPTLEFSLQTPENRQEAQLRREAATARIMQETGIDQPMIDTLVDGFYDRVRQDDLIGPVFTAKISDWGPHLEQMKLFWSSVALSTSVYQGRPMPKHMPLPIDARHFDRWLSLFEDTARTLCPPIAAEHFIVRARRIAQSLELGVANAAGVLLDNGERYIRRDSGWTP